MAMKMRATGLSEDAVFEALEEFGRNDLDVNAGGTFAYIYDAGPDVDRIAKRAYTRYLTENALDPTVYPSLLRFENEIVAMAISHLNGDAEVVGNFTSGGTESCLLAVKTARDYFREIRPEITAPEIILPVTAHAAFQKAAQYFCLKPVLVPVDSATFKADPEAIRAAITPNTIQIVASAVSYAHGVVDPIEDIAAIARENDLLFHVDGCIGGFMLPFWKRLGEPVPPFDFSVPGVTSMSMDFHKYAYCPKGASVILQRGKHLRRHQIFTCSNWTGYTVINPTILSTKTGGPMAACWAVLNYLGDEGYMRIAARMLDATKKIRAGIEAMDDYEILGDPELCLIAFTSDTLSVFPVIDEMKKRGWFIQPQLGFYGSRENIHLSIDQASLDRADAMLADLAECTEIVKAKNEQLVPDDIKAFVKGLTPADFTPELFQDFMKMLGSAESGALPEGTSEINELLNVMDPDVAKKALTEYMNELYVPPKHNAAD